MSKEEIWSNRNPSCAGKYCFGHQTAMMCMDEYAKQVAVDLLKWMKDNKMIIDIGVYGITAEQLYLEYQKESTKKMNYGNVI